MAKLTGIVKLEGTIDDLTFVRTKDGYQAKRKTFMKGDKIKTDPQFERTRENMAEFTQATKAGKVLRQAMRSLIKVAKDRKVTGRVMARMMQALKVDIGNLRGQRTVTGGDLTLLERLEFNIEAPLPQTVKVQYNGTIDRVTGINQVQVPAMTPLSDIAAPPGTSHYKLVAAVAAIDFEAGTYIYDQREAAILPWTAAPTPALTLSPTIAANSTLPLFLVLGVQFYTEHAGNYYPLKDSSNNALAILRVDAN
jgi:hypothetical protein